MARRKDSCPSKYIIDVRESWWFAPSPEWCEKKIIIKIKLFPMWIVLYWSH